MHCLYRWVDCLNVELARPRQLPNITPPQNDTILYDSDEEVFFECMNRANLHNLLNHLRMQYRHAWYLQVYHVPPPPIYTPITRSR